MGSSDANKQPHMIVKGNFTNSIAYGQGDRSKRTRPHHAAGPNKKDITIPEKRKQEFPAKKTRGIGPASAAQTVSNSRQSETRKTLTKPHTGHRPGLQPSSKERGPDKPKAAADTASGSSSDDENNNDQILKGVDPQHRIRSTIIPYSDDADERVRWDDVAGLEEVKQALKEAVIYPMLRPDIFSGLREPGKGMLLFGPPGTGKTMLAQALATEAKPTFFSISSSTLTSKVWGGNEQLVHDLFTLAKVHAPSIIFIDEVESLLSQRAADKTEHEVSRKTKNEFLQLWSGLQSPVTSGAHKPKQVFILGATNMPWEIDEAARRRFTHRSYIPLPDSHVREQQLLRLPSSLP